MSTRKLIGLAKRYVQEPTEENWDTLLQECKEHPEIIEVLLEGEYSQVRDPDSTMKGNR